MPKLVFDCAQVTKFAVVRQKKSSSVHNILEFACKDNLVSYKLLLFIKQFITVRSAEILRGDTCDWLEFL